MIRRTIPFLSAILSLMLIIPASAATKKSAPEPTVKKALPVKPAPAKTPQTALEPFAATDDGGVPQISASSCIVIDADSGRILHQINADQPRPVASTQKLLTSLIVAESGNLDARVRVEAPDTWAEPTMLYLKPGDVYERNQLLQILLVKSMNDVARCLARDNAGSIESFAERMNSRARELGMTNSHFVNPNGLPATGQYSTARDMSRLAKEAYRNPTIRNFVRLRTVNFRYADGRTRVFENTNQVLKNFPFCNGMKTGYTEAAGHCLISSASRNGRNVIAVVLGDSKRIWIDSYRLLAWALSS